MKNQYILITVSGPDTPGITASLMNIIKESECAIKDMGQSVTHGLLSLSILIDTGDETKPSSPVLKDLLFQAKKLGLTLDFEIVENGENPNDIHNTDRFILNCVGVSDLTPAFMGDISGLLASKDANILRIDNVEPSHFKSIEITTLLPEECDLKTLKKEIYKISTFHQFDVALIKDDVFRRNKRLIVFDMDSTLIQTEVIDEMAKIRGVGDEVIAVTEAAMNGEIDFNESLKQRVSKLKGLKESELSNILENLKFTPGTEEFIKVVKSIGYKVALISGGFTFFANALKEKLGLDYAFANELEIKSGELTGNVVGTIVNAEQKALLLQLITQQEGISLEQTVAIGDGANDLPMLSAAGLGIAFHAKDTVRKKAEQHMSHGPMTTILYFLGMSADEMSRLSTTN